MAAEAPGQAAPGRLRILLVDDELAGAEVLALVLAGEGHQVTLAPDARQALARLDEAVPELLVCDFMLPGMNGAELVRAIRARPGFEAVPAILISGAPESAVRRHGVEYQAFLRKPFSLGAFLRVLAELEQAGSRAGGTGPA